MNVMKVSSLGCCSGSNKNYATFSGGFVKIKGEWYDALKGMSRVNEASTYASDLLDLQISGSATKIVDYLPLKTYANKQLLRLTGEDAKLVKTMITKNSSDLRTTLNKYFTGLFRLSDSTHMHIDELSAKVKTFTLGAQQQTAQNKVAS